MSKLSEDQKLWKRARETMEKIQSGEITASSSQIQRLQDYLDGYEAFKEADFELKRGIL